jgi:hypothetical protein
VQNLQSRQRDQSQRIHPGWLGGCHSRRNSQRQVVAVDYLDPAGDGVARLVGHAAMGGCGQHSERGGESGCQKSCGCLARKSARIHPDGGDEGCSCWKLSLRCLASFPNGVAAAVHVFRSDRRYRCCCGRDNAMSRSRGVVSHSALFVDLRRLAGSNCVAIPLHSAARLSVDHPSVHCDLS